MGGRGFWQWPTPPAQTSSAWVPERAGGLSAGTSKRGFPLQGHFPGPSQSPPFEHLLEAHSYYRVVIIVFNPDKNSANRDHQPLRTDEESDTQPGHVSLPGSGGGPADSPLNGGLKREREGRGAGAESGFQSTFSVVEVEDKMRGDGVSEPVPPRSQLKVQGLSSAHVTAPSGERSRP